jgi:gelsolin
MSSIHQDTLEMIHSENFKTKMNAAKSEKEFDGCGKKAGLTVWRVEKFKLHKVPESDVGHFYNGDSYLLLSSVGTEPNLHHTIFFWLGSKTTLDESGTAAYKAVELDTFLGSTPTISRETEGKESPQFAALFPKGFKILQGGIDSGFHHVKPEDYIPKLLHVRGNTRVYVTEDPLSCSSLNHSDAFILDAGLKVYQWIGEKATINEKFKANMMMHDIKDSRKGCEVIELTPAGSDDFWKLLGGKTTIKEADEGKPDDVEGHSQRTPELYVLTEDKSHFSFKKQAEGKLTMDMLKSTDSYIVDFGDNCCLWVGKGTPKKEKSHAMILCNDYLGVHNRPSWLSVAVVHEGHEGPEFKKRMH